jgi:DNA-binding winged helix-turn-helix (wHTH) protein
MAMAQPFVLDPTTRTLRDNRSLVHLEPKVFDLVTLLVEERHRIVSRSELNLRLWNAEYVCDGALTQSIWCARRALGDSARGSRYILTAHRHGYRFIGQVEERRRTDGNPAFLLSRACPGVIRARPPERGWSEPRP